MIQPPEGLRHLRQLLQGMQALPVGRRIGAIDRVGVVELIVAARHELRV